MSQQSDAHSVSSGLSNNSSVVPPLLKTASSSVASSSQQQQQQQQQVPIVQNPFDTLSSSSSASSQRQPPIPTTLTNHSNNSNHNNVPPSHVAVRMPLPTTTTNAPMMMMMMMSPQPLAPQSQMPSPMKTNRIGTSTSLSMPSTPPPPKTTTGSTTTNNAPSTTTGIPIMGSHSNISIPVVPPLPHQPTYSNTTSTSTTTTTTTISSPLVQPPPPPSSMNPSYNTDFPMYDHPPSAPLHMTNNMAGTNTTTTTTAIYAPNDFIFDDDENTVPSSLGNTTDDQLSQQQQQQYYRRNHHSQTHHSSNAQEFDPASFPTMIGNSSLTSRIIESTKRFITSGSSHDLNPDPPLPPSHRSMNNTTTTTTTPVLTATSLPHNRHHHHHNNNIPDHHAPCLISGYLQKLGRNQKWQTRWFETNGIYLSYYKSSKRSNLLATLDLQKVGVIEIDTEDKTEHSFRIQVLGRLYQLRANSRASCQDWVITLNRVKEARMQQGNVKLVGLPTTTTTSSSTNTKRPLVTNTPLDLFNPSTPSVSSQQQQQQHQLLNNDSENNFLDGTPRVVVVSNRERTHGVDEEDEWDQLIRIDDNTGATYNDTDIDPAASQVETIYSGSSKRLSSIGTVVAARWTKHQSKMQRLGNKFSKWARSIKKYSCTDNNDAVIVTSGGRPTHSDVVHLDKYLHPPGHDDKLQKQQQQQQQVLSKMQSPSMPITTNSTTTSSSSNNTANTMPITTNNNASTAISASAATATSAVPSSVLPTTIGSTTTTISGMNKPLAINDRAISSASDYDARMLS